MKRNTFLMTLALLLAIVQGAWAQTERTQTVPVTIYSWDDVNKQLVKTQEDKECLCLGFYDDEDWVYLGEKDKTTWYYDGGKRNIHPKVFVILGEVHLVLSWGTNVSLKHIKLEAKNNAKLHIHNKYGDDAGYIEVENWYTTESLNQVQCVYQRRHYRYYDDAAAIGGGRGESMGSIYMHGGYLSASIQDECNAAIGGGKDGSIDPNHEIVVYAGTLKGETVYPIITQELQKEYGGYLEFHQVKEPCGAAIGGSDNHPQGGPITVYGGTLWAVNNGRGAGIGGGEDSFGGTVNVYGGRVIVEKKDDIKKGGAGIGGGYEGGGGDVHIYGGTVEAVGGSYSAAIGGYQGHGKGTIEFAPDMRVTAGGYDYVNGSANPERVFTNGEREGACQWRSWAKVEVYDHTKPTVGSDDTEPITYSIDDIYHTRHCRYCDYTVKEEHEGTNCICGKTSIYRFTVHHPGTVKDTYAEGSTIAVGASLDFYLPACQNVPDGYTFKGWEMNPDPDGGNHWAAVLGEDIKEAGSSVKIYLGQDKVVNFYARFLYDFTPAWTWNGDGSSASVTLSHKDLADVTLSSTGDDPKVSIQSEELKDEADNTIGTHYTATCTYNVNGYDYTFTDEHDIINVPETQDITLQDNDDNSEILSNNYNRPVNATLTGRTLYKDGTWNTLCLPFDVSVLEGSALEGAMVKTLESSDYDSTTGQLTLNFTSGSLTTLSAGVPYLVKWESGSGTVVAPTFSSVTISNMQGGTVGSQYVDFVGSFSPVTLTANDKTLLYLGAGNKLYYPSATVTVNACRAVFRLHNGITAGNIATGARSFVLNFGDGETTEISTTNITNHANEAGAWYDLQGRRLSGQPTTKGLYINNGKKIVVK